MYILTLIVTVCPYMVYTTNYRAHNKVTRCDCNGFYIIINFIAIQLSSEYCVYILHYPYLEQFCYSNCAAKMSAVLARSCEWLLYLWEHLCDTDRRRDSS